MEQICERAREALRDAGLTVQSAMPSTAAQRVRAPLVSVGMERWALVTRPVYLGLQEQLEIYGCRLEGTLQAMAHGPRDGGASGVAALAQTVMAVLSAGLAEVTVRRVEAGAAAYDAALDCFVCPVRAEVEAWLYAVPREDGLYFEDFVLRGQLRSGQEETK